DFFGKEQSKPGDVVLEVRNISRREVADDPNAINLHDVSFNVRSGEIVGLAGLVGSGRTDLVRCIFGIDARDSGEIFINGQRIDIQSPRDAIRAGMGFVPEDRKLQALFLAMSVKENASMASLSNVARYGFVNGRAQNNLVANYVKQLSIHLANVEQRVMDLS